MEGDVQIMEMIDDIGNEDDDKDDVDDGDDANLVLALISNGWAQEVATCWPPVTSRYHMANTNPNLKNAPNLTGIGSLLNCWA